MSACFRTSASISLNETPARAMFLSGMNARSGRSASRGRSFVGSVTTVLSERLKTALTGRVEKRIV